MTYPSTKALLTATLGGVVLLTSLSSNADAQNRRDHHNVIAAAIANMFTGQAALRGIVLPDSTIPRMQEDWIADRNADMSKTHFPGNAQLVALAAKGFQKEVPPMKFERVLMADAKVKFDFISMDELRSMGIDPTTPTDSSWRLFKAKYPEQMAFVSFSVPGYDSGGDLALVSYFTLCASGCYNKGYVLLERNPTTRVWRVIRRGIIYGGG